MFYGLLINNFYKTKFNYLKEMMNNFYFTSKESEKENFLKYFFTIQKIYSILNRFCFQYKLKKSKIIVNTDLQLNDIQINQKNVICIYHNKYKYLFKIEDLLKIIYISLTNNYLFFAEPIAIKNPYNNLHFGKSILYAIYFYLIQKANYEFLNFKHIDLFMKFKQCDFNMTSFVDKYEHILRDYSIDNFITSSAKYQIVSEIKKMISQYNETRYKKNKIIIDNGFPENELIKIMKPYLTLYLSSKRSLIPKMKNYSKNVLYKKLFEFKKYNPAFGRKILFTKKIFCGGKIILKSHFEYSLNHKKFYSNGNNNFMENHLCYKYENTEYNYGENDENDENDESDDENIIPLISEATLIYRVINYNNQTNNNEIEANDNDTETNDNVMNDNDTETNDNDMNDNDTETNDSSEETIVDDIVLDDTDSIS
jgi:hypothetical protein